MLKLLALFLFYQFYSQIQIVHDHPSTSISALQEDPNYVKPEKEENSNQNNIYQYIFSQRPPSKSKQFGFIYFQDSCQIPGTAEIIGKTFASQLITKTLTINEKLQVEGEVQSKSVKSKEIHAQSIQLDTLTSLNVRNKFYEIIIKGILNIKGNLYINSMTIENSIQARSFLLNGKYNITGLQNFVDIRQWQIIQHDDFESKESLEGWNFTELSSCDNINYFLGGYCKLSHQEVCKTFHTTVPHSATKLNANLHILDDWEENEFIYLKVNKQIVFVEVIDSKGIINICGGDSPDVKFAQPIEYQFDHNSTQFEVCFGSSLTEPSDHCKQSFGIDDVIIEIK